MVFLRVKKAEWGSGSRAYLYLAESKRVNGKVQQKSLDYLGKVTEAWGLKDLFYLCTGATHWKGGNDHWHSDYQRFTTFPEIKQKYPSFDIGKALAKIADRIFMATCVLTTMIRDEVSYPFPKRFQRSFADCGALVPILRVIEKRLRELEKARWVLIEFHDIWSDEAIERGRYWLEEWMPSVVSKIPSAELHTTNQLLKGVA